MLSTILLSLMLSFGQQAPGAVPVSNEGPVIITTGEGVVKAAPDRVCDLYIAHVNPAARQR